MTSRVQFCGNTQHVIMFSRAAKLLKYFANGPAKYVADLRSEILVQFGAIKPTNTESVAPNCLSVSRHL